jgi:8-oxo-dGTP pyrophosphatase MutT (NUDIX family)
MKMPKEKSAGVVVLRWSRDGWQFLALETTMRDDDGNRRLDLPKGHLERGEGWLEAAVRETSEEAGISKEDLDFTWGERHFDCFKQGKVSRMFIASTRATPKIQRNPVSHRYEHVKPLWLDLIGDSRERMIHKYLQGSLEWARSVVMSRSVKSGHEISHERGSEIGLPTSNRGSADITKR